MIDQTKIIKKLLRIENQLNQVRGREYDLPFGSSARAKMSRKWDELAKEKFYLVKLLRDTQTRDVEGCEYYQHNECDCTYKCEWGKKAGGYIGEALRS